MERLEEKVLQSFIKIANKEVKGLNLISCISPDCWPDDDGNYTCEVMERQDNGKVWECCCTKNGNVKEYFEI